MTADLKSLAIDRGPARPSSSGPRTRRKAPIGALVALALLATAAWLFGPTLLSFADRLRLPAVRTFLVTEAAPAAAAAIRGTAANGYVVAARRAALSSDVPGRIVELNVEEGSVVKRGDVVARLFADEFRAAWQRAEANLVAATASVTRAEAAVRAAAAELAQAERNRDNTAALRDEAQAQLVFADAEFERLERLFETGIEGQSAIDRGRADRDARRARVAATDTAVAAAGTAVEAARERFAVARADVAVQTAQRAAAEATRDEARATLDKTDVRAPFDGIVVLKDAEVGEVVSPNVVGGSTARGAVCTMVDFDSLEVQANVPETSLASVAIGAPADVFLDAFPNDRYAGVVDRIWPTADRQKATVEVHIRLERKDERLRPEMGVRIVFRRDASPPPADVANAPRIVVPEQAVVAVDGRDGAFVVEQDVVRFAAVALGERKNGRVAIDSGLRPNQRIVLAPPSSLRDGDRVRLADN